MCILLDKYICYILYIIDVSYIYIYSYIHMDLLVQKPGKIPINPYIYIYIYIRRPWPSPRPGRRLGPPEVWILSFLNLCHAVDPVFLAPLPRPHCRQTPSQGHSNGSRAPHGRSNGFFYRRSRLPAVPALQPAVCVHSALSLGRPCLGHARRQKPPRGHSNGSRHPPGRSNGFL